MPVNAYRPIKLISAAGVNAQCLNPVASLVGFIVVSNTSTNPRFVKFYDEATAPNVGVDVPLLTFIASGDVTGTSGTSTSVPIAGAGLQFLNGIAIAITGGAADSDTTAINANDVTVNLGWTANYD